MERSCLLRFHPPQPKRLLPDWSLCQNDFQFMVTPAPLAVIPATDSNGLSWETLVLQNEPENKLVGVNTPEVEKPLAWPKSSWGIK